MRGNAADSTSGTTLSGEPSPIDQIDGAVIAQRHRRGQDSVAESTDAPSTSCAPGSDPTQHAGANASFKVSGSDSNVSFPSQLAATAGFQGVEEAGESPVGFRHGSAFVDYATAQGENDEKIGDNACNPLQHCNVTKTATFNSDDPLIIQEDWELVVDVLSDERESKIPLQEWIEFENKRTIHQDRRHQMNLQKASYLRKLTVAYGISKLLKSSTQNPVTCALDNFSVGELCDTPSQGYDAGWEVRSVDMITPPVSLRLSATSSINSKVFEIDETEDISGRNISTTIVKKCSGTLLDAKCKPCDEMLLCYKLGEMLHFLFSGETVSQGNFQANGHGNREELTKDDCLFEKALAELPPKKQSRSSFSQSLSISGSNSDSNVNRRLSFQEFCPLSEKGCPISISQLVGNLLACGDGLFRSDDSYSCVEDAIDDMHLLLEEPHRFLFEPLNTSYHGKTLLTFPNDRMFGRSAEASKITQAFSRVVSTGRSEIIIVSGYSGSGKTRLVQSVFEGVEVVKGYIVERKFEETSTQSCLMIVLSAFNELCSQIAHMKPNEDLNAIYQNLITEFGANFHLLARILPNVLSVLSTVETAQPFNNEIEIDSSVNFLSLCFTLQRFMRVVSRSVGPGMLFLDDIQWADPISLGLVHAVLSDMEGSNSMLFVGSYRNNEIPCGHHLFEFFHVLSKINIPFTTIHLDGMPENDVKSMISDALGIVPRLCRSLSCAVHRKTKGNPFFVREFLRTLVDRNLVTYSLRERRWIWDVDKINAEQITDNVLHLISLKMNLLSNDRQRALKAVSCFGMKVKISIVNDLSTTQQYLNLQAAVNDAVQDGFMEMDGEYYCFVHDKVRESAYDLISIDERDKYHFEIGMSLYRSRVGRFGDEDEDILFTIVEQINYGVPALLSSQSYQIPIAQLNCQAGLATMKRWNFVGALTYLKAALSLLPTLCWTSHYDFSLTVHYQLARAAYPCGAINEAKDALNKIVESGKCLEDTLDAYYLLVNILYHAQEELSQALITCCKVLKLLGEDMPYNPDTGHSALSHLVEITKTRLHCALTTNNALLNMPRTECKRTVAIMKFYSQLALVSYNKGPLLCGYYISRWVSFSLSKMVVCRYTPVALAFYSAVLAYGLNERNCLEAYRIGKIALTLLNESEHKMEMPRVYLSFYCYVGVMFEPMQACLEQHRRAYEVGMQVGNTSDAFFNLVVMIPRMVESGTNLDILNKEIEFYLRVAEEHSHPILATYMTWYQDALSLLLDDGSGAVEVAPLASDQSKIMDATAIHLVQLLMPAFYLGRMERVKFLSKKWDCMDADRKSRIPTRCVLVAFYDGLASIAIYRQKKKNALLSRVEKSVSVLTKGAFSRFFCSYYR
eukprot:CCRYP_003442-RB/>CCRYP_003442-RB protein AED:0.05 eAED:0.05 QI:255/1/1/1/1/1/3/704/1362